MKTEARRANSASEDHVLSEAMGRLPLLAEKWSPYPEESQRPDQGGLLEPLRRAGKLEPLKRALAGYWSQWTNDSSGSAGPDHGTHGEDRVSSDNDDDEVSNRRFGSRSPWAPAPGRVSVVHASRGQSGTGGGFSLPSRPYRRGPVWASLLWPDQIS